MLFDSLCFSFDRQAMTIARSPATRHEQPTATTILISHLVITSPVGQDCEADGVRRLKRSFAGVGLRLWQFELGPTAIAVAGLGCGRRDAERRAIGILPVGIDAEGLCRTRNRRVHRQCHADNNALHRAPPNEKPQHDGWGEDRPRASGGRSVTTDHSSDI